jgi:hypothetical protein
MAVDLKTTRIGELARSTSKLNWGKIFKLIFERRDVALFVEELNRQRLNRGKTTQDKDITNLKTGSSKYSPTTVAIYKKIGRRIVAGQNYTMKHTGKFHRSIKVTTVTQNYIEIGSDPLKPEVNLFKTYGTFLIGASETDLQKLRQKVLPLIYETVRNELLK